MDISRGVRMKKACMVIIFVLLTLSLASCACEHEWLDATCTQSVVCSKCGETAGNALGHTWVDATCATPKTCSVCATTEGGLASHQYSNGACSMCGVADPKAAQVTNAEIAYTNLLIAEGYCDMFSSMIYDAWYFAIYKSDDYTSGSKAISAFSKSVGINESLVTAGVDSYLNKVGYSITDLHRCAVISTNSGALYVVDYALSNNDGFANAKECLDDAKTLIKSLDANYASVNAYSELSSYYSAVSSYFDFCYSPNGSFSQLSASLNSYRANCEASRNKCDIYF